MANLKDNPRVLVVKSNGCSDYYFIDSIQTFNEPAFNYLKVHLEAGTYEYADNYFRESYINERADRELIDLNEAEVVSLPTVLREKAEEYRKAHQANLEHARKISRGIDLIKKAVRSEDKSQAWQLLSWAEDNNLSSRDNSVELEHFNDMIR